MEIIHHLVLATDREMFCVSEVNRDIGSRDMMRIKLTISGPNLSPEREQLTEYGWVRAATVQWKYQIVYD